MEVKSSWSQRRSPQTWRQNNTESNGTKAGEILIGPKNVIRESRGLGRLLYESLLKHGEQIMQVDGYTGEEDSFSNFFTRTRRLAIHLRQTGFHPQDRIAICSYNSLNSAVPLIASFFLGVIPTGLDPTFSSEDLKYFLQIIKPKAVFACPEIADLISNILKNLNIKSKIIVFGSSDLYESFDNYVKPTKSEELFQPFQPLSVRDTVMLIFSSGTTGKPKEICLSHFYFFGFTQTPFLFYQDRILIFSSLYWISQVALSVVNIAIGTVKIICPKFEDPATVAQVIERCKVKSMFLPTPYLVDVINYCRTKRITPSVEVIPVGGMPVTQKLISDAMEIFPSAKLMHGYGQSESSIISGYDLKKPYTNFDIEKLMKRSCGKVYPGVKLKIVDLETEEILGAYQEGEIHVKSYTMTGYYNTDPSEGFDSDGWLKTGDIGYYDEDEYLYIIDRCKEMLKYRSFPVSPSFLEDIIVRHPAVKKAIVTGLPHDVDGDHPIAFVILKDNLKVDPEEIRTFVDEQVDDRKKLRGGVKIIDTIPLTTTGKPCRRKLRDMFLHQKS